MKKIVLAALLTAGFASPSYATSFLYYLTGQTQENGKTMCHYANGTIIATNGMCALSIRG